MLYHADATNNFDQARFFQENAEQVFQVISETAMIQIEKIKRKCSSVKLSFSTNDNDFALFIEKTDRPTSWNSKELTSLQKTLFLLRKMFLYVPELMRNGWQRHSIGMSTFLDCHRKLCYAEKSVSK
jgi:hypothetical protein